MGQVFPQRCGCRHDGVGADVCPTVWGRVIVPRGQGGGRPRKPTHLKLLHGDDKTHPERINKAEPQPSLGAVKPPWDLSEAGQANWDRMAPDRIRLGVLTPWDVEAFAAFCEAVEHARKALLGEDLLAAQRAVNICATLGGRFGWTPADRTKLITKFGGEDGRPKGRLLS